MSVFDKLVAAVTPPESQADRAEARTQAEQFARPGDWLSLILDHHRQLEAAFAEARTGNDGMTRTTAFKRLQLLLNAHSAAEETVIYPALADTHQKAHAEMGYNEQAMVKVQMALLEQMDPMSQDWTDKLEHIEGAVLHHVYQEEGTWFQELARDGEAKSAMLTQRYMEEFERYMSGAGHSAGGQGASGQTASWEATHGTHEPALSAGRVS